MAFIAIPGLIALVPHSCGGAILSTASGGYVAGTLIPASVVTAAPAVLGTVLVAGVVAGSAYLYLHGIPAPMAEIFAAKGLGSFASAAASSVVETPVFAASPIATTTPAFVVPVAYIATVLAALAVVGYIAYTYSDTIKNAVDSAAAKVKASALVTVAEIIDALKKTTSATSKCTAVVMEDTKTKLYNFVDTVDQVVDNMKENIISKTNQLKESFEQGVDKVVTPENIAEIAEDLVKMATLVSICTEKASKDAKAKIKDVTDAIDQLAEKAKEGVACNVSQLKAMIDKATDKLDNSFVDIKKHFTPNDLKS